MTETPASQDPRWIRAEADLRAFCETRGFDLEALEDWSTLVMIVYNPKLGLEDAKKTIVEESEKHLSEARQRERQERVTKDKLSAAIAPVGSLNDDIRNIVEQLADAYVGGHRVNLALGRTLLAWEHDELREQWNMVRDVAGKIPNCIFTNFHSYPATDKAAAGHGNVGNTLDTRRYQGNLLVFINGVKFNIHINTTSASED
ncbi:hypothetical protein QR77_38170 [Streptomyces sp. 150FB]|uniref:hypothetical protein n=1 Tax=Streptomyces sp. 150FB TaxID=1576605 RepID=UPI00058923C5|nr:hypothetical protein [Streptomyces sp. 150FB]KIF78065.1 hypothetical protein QR77_38170 [Streptomyces sp. 150FB]